MTRRVGYALSLSSSVYVFGTQGISSLPTSTDSAWSSAWTLARGFLDFTKPPRWEETCEPLEGDLRVSQLAFTLHDAPAPSGPAVGYPLLSWLTTRLPSQITRTILRETLSRTGLTIKVAVGTGALLGSFPRVLWIDGEAILCASISTDDITVTSTAQRGYYGTRATAHVVDPSRSYAPSVWISMPWVRRRKAILWWVDLDTNVAKRLWTGVCGRSPRLGRNGAQVELQCDSLAQVLREHPLGLPSAVCTTMGWNRNAIVLTVQGGDHRGTTASAGGAGSDWSDPDALTVTFQQAAEQQILELRADLEDKGIPTYGASLYQSGPGADFRVDISTTSNSPATIRVALWGGEVAEDTSAGSTDHQIMTAHLEEVPPTLLVADPQQTRPIGVDNTAGLPSTVTDPAVGDTNDGIITGVRVMLRGAYNDDSWLNVYPSAMGLAALPYLDAVAEFKPRKAVPSVDSGLQLGLSITKRVQLAVTTRVNSPHWLHGLRYGVLADLADSLGDLLDAGDWDWTDFGRCVGLTPGIVHWRDWYLNGETKLGSLVSDGCKVSGFGQGVREGKLSLFALQPPVSDQPVAATISATKLVGLPTWSAFPDGLANYVEFDGELLKATLPMPDSISKYGPGRSIKVTLAGLPAEAVLATSPSELLSVALARMAGLWSEPVAIATLTLTTEYLFDTPVYQGDYITVTEWLLPDGAGDRGLTSRTLQVLTRAVDLDTGTVTLTCLDWYREGLRGWSPCGRVESIDDDTITLAAPGYLDGTTDYAGSDRDGYRYTADDGGTGWFAAGYKVRLVLRNSTTATAEVALEILSVNPATREIVLTTSVPTVPTDWAAEVAGGAMVDLVFDNYNDVTETQQGVGGYIGAEFGDIDGSGDPLQVWSP